MTFNLGNGKDVADIANAMMLNEEETPSINFLSVGSMIVKLKGRFHQPVLVNFAEIDIDKGFITNEKVREHMKKSIGFPLRV